MPIVTYRRAELYEQVWKKPVRTVAKRYGISDVALGKVCRRLKIPLPGLGHWTRVRLGQVIPRPPLPSLSEGDPAEIVHERWQPRKVLPRTEPTEPPIPVPETLRHPHKLVSESSRILRGTEPRDGAVHSRNARCLDVNVSKASLSRALRIMNALIRALEKRGLKVEVTRPMTWAEIGQRRRSDNDVFDNATRVQIQGEWIKFGIWEKGSVVQVPAEEPPKHLKGAERESWTYWHREHREVQPNGTLELCIKTSTWPNVRSTWHDGKKKRVEDCLNDFIAHLYFTAEAIKKHREDLRDAELARAEEERKRWEEECRRREEAEHEKRFREDLAHWRVARDARQYIAELRGLAEAKGLVEEGSALDKSLRWIESFADRVDPLSELRRDTDTWSDPPAQDGSEDG